MEEVGNQPNDAADVQVFSQEHHDAHIESAIDNHDVHHMEHNDETSHIKAGATVHHEDLLTWESSEYIFHERSSLWYVGFGLITLLAVVLVYFLSGRSIWASTMVVVMGVTVIVFSRNHPSMRRYTISTDGISVGDKHFDYEQFKSFSIIQEGKLLSVALNPVNRFMPPVSMYVPMDNGDQILGLLSEYLPHLEKEQTVVDQALARLKF